jgi:phage/plasmid-associated DNA primase
MSNLLSLKISSYENCLDGITLCEPIDENILEKLINSKLLKDNFNNPFSARFFTTEKQQLLKYKSIVKDGKAIVNYNRSKIPYGRCNPDNALGLYSIRREIRHTLAKNRFTDTDISNAHPTFMLQILQANKEEINCSFTYLEDYVNNRDVWLKFIMDNFGVNRDTAKNLPLIILFGGGMSTWIKKNTTPDKKTGKINLDIKGVNKKYIKDGSIIEPKRIKKLTEEYKHIAKLVADNNPDLCEQVEKIKLEQGKEKHTYNFNGSVNSFFLQEIEVRVLEIVFKYCIDNKYIKDDICVLCADGLMIETKYYKPCLLTEFSKIVEDQTGLKLLFTTKDMCEGYLEKEKPTDKLCILDKNLCFDLYTPQFTTGMIADYFKIMFSNKFVKVDNKVYMFNGIYWKEEDKSLSNLHNFVDNVFHAHLNKYICDLIAPISNDIAKLASELSELKIKLNYNNGEDGELGAIQREIDIFEKDIKELEEVKRGYEKFKDNLSSLRNIYTRTGFVNEICNKVMNSNIKFDEDPYMFAFNNKIYNLKTHRFLDSSDISYDLYISTTTGYNWSNFYNESKVDKLEKLIDTILTDKDVKDYYLSALATGLYGEQIENLFIATGEGGNGKSLLNSLMLKAVGCYGYKLPVSVILSELKSGGDPQVANMHKKRFVLSQEPSGKKHVCTSTIKELTGDKTMNSRLLHSNDCGIDLCLSLFMECNDLPLLDEVNDAVQRRIRAILFGSMFVSKDTYDSYEDKTNIFIGDKYYKSNEFQEDYKQALIIILMRYWKMFLDNGKNLPILPTKCKEITNGYLAVSDDIYEWFSQYYEKKVEVNSKGEPVNVLTVSDVCEKFTNSRYFLNLSKADKRSFNDKKFREKVEKNLFLKPFYKDRKKVYVNGKQNTVPLIINWVEKVEESNGCSQNDFIDD